MKPGILQQAGLAMLAACPLLAQGALGQDALEIVRESVNRDANNVERLKNYAFIEREEQRLYNKAGKLTSTESNSSEILILGGRPYGRKVEHNDKPLSEREARKEREKLDRESDKRKNESSSEKARLDKERAENRRFLGEIPEAFTFRLLGVEQVSGKPAWLIEATPKPGFKPKDRRATILSKVRAKFWIDQAEYQWVKVEAEVLDTISVGLGLFRIAPGGTIRFEQTRMNDEVWVPLLVAVRADARLGYVKRLHGEVDVTYRDYKKFQSDSRIVPEDESRP